jgi:signal transduction histidine kinase
MQLGHHHEAEESFRNAFNRLKSLVEHDDNFTWLNDLARVSYNILDAYTTAGNYQEAVKWVPIAEEAIMQMIASPKCDKETAESYRGCLNTHKAIILYKTGHKEEAEKAYKEFLKSDYANSSIGLIDNAEYLEAIENWKDRSNLATRIDSLAKAWEMPPSMYYYKSYLMPNLKAHIKSGRTNEALKIALHITENIDSLDLFERKHNAEELAIIYETQEKEMKIAEQETQLRYQRAIAIIVAILVLMVFWIIFLYFRQRAALKLAEKNKELEQKNQELTVANAKAEESSKMKTNFIQQISHEIRTPLNILSGFTQVITTPGMELDEETRSDINRQITENTDRITGLVNKMLELSDVSSQTVIERNDNAFGIQLAAQAADASGINDAGHLTFDMDIAPDSENTELKTNEQQATRALALLLDNAIKFTKKGKVTLRINTDQQRNTLNYVVEDTGIGIPANEAEHIFEEFVQLDDYYDGTGIGLTVARSITRRLGGDIILDTTYTAGARFVMSLPL